MPETSPASIRAPRRRLIRLVLRLLGRLVGLFAARMRIVGREKSPRQGPLIVIANHVDEIDGFILSLYLPFVGETMVAADLPMPWLARVIFTLYGFIPVMRGMSGGDSTKLALSVLEQKGVVILFPEGGIWRTANKPVHTGVAWLSQKSQAAVLPIGLMGTRKALPNMLRLKRPKIEMHIGALIPPPLAPDAPYNKAALQAAANAMMAAAEALIPQQEHQQVIAFDTMTLDFRTQVQDAQGRILTPESTLTSVQAQALGKLYYDLSILETLWKGNKIPIQVLLQPHTPQPAAAVAEAIDRVFAYLETEYESFFSYRFGKADDEAMRQGFRVIQQQAQTLGAVSMTLIPSAVAQDAEQEKVLERL